MSVAANFTVPADEFALGELLEVPGEPEIRLESLIPTGDSVMPYFWVSGDHADAVETTLLSSDVIEEVAVVDESGSEVLFRVAWSDEVDGLFGLVRDADAALLAAEGLGDEWEFRFRFPDRDALSGFYRSCVEKDLTVELEEVKGSFEPTGPEGFGVTEPQREVLLTGLEEGYFDVPRGINLTELADRLGVSDTAASQRIRRGMKSLLTATLEPREPGDNGGSDDE